MKTIAKFYFVCLGKSYKYYLEGHLACLFCFVYFFEKNYTRMCQLILEKEKYLYFLPLKRLKLNLGMKFPIKCNTFTRNSITFG